MTGDHSDLRDGGMCRQNRLDLARFDAEPANLDLIVYATDELQIPVNTLTNQIPGCDTFVH
jgi:hypothetical protein